MREIKFRAWDKKEKKFHYFSFNDFCGYEELLEMEALIGNCSGVYLRDGFFFSTNTNDRKGEVCPWIEITQFTGLLDKNGREIWEGDIINKNQPYEIVFFRGGFHTHGFSKKGKEFWQTLDTWIDEDDNERLFKYEVIGNVFENPELLK